MHRDLFTAMRTLAAEQKQVDIPAIAEALTRLYGSDELMAHLLGVVGETSRLGGAWALKQNIEIIKGAATRRRALEIIESAHDDLIEAANDTAAVLDKTRQALRDMTISGHKWLRLSDVLLNTFTLLERRAKGDEQGIPTGIPMLDKHTGGLHRGELTVIGARPAVGKSALGAQIALSAARHGHKVAICSREMTDVQYGVRVFSKYTNVRNVDMRSGQLGDDDWTQVLQAMTACADMQVDFLFTTRYIEDLRAEVQRKVDGEGLDVLMVDYMQLLQSKQKFNKDFERIAYVSKALKDMTTDLNIAIVALAQVGRASEGSMPTLAELRGSGDIEQDADNVFFMHRPTVDDRDITQDERQIINGLEMQKLRYIILNIAKQRQGDTGEITLAFNPAKMSFTEF